jgi:hypothetical protein
VRQIFLARKEAQEWTALLRNLVANRAPQHGVIRLQGIEQGSLCDRWLNLNLHFGSGVSQGAQMLWKHDSNHIHWLRQKPRLRNAVPEGIPHCDQG